MRKASHREAQAVPKATGKRPADERPADDRPADDRADDGGLSEGEVSEGGASVASSASKLARQVRNGFDIR